LAVPLSRCMYGERETTTSPPRRASLEMSVWTRFYRGLSACFRRFTGGRTKRLRFSPSSSTESVIRCGARSSSALELAHPLGVGFLFTDVGGDEVNPFEWVINKVAFGLKGLCLSRDFETNQCALFQRWFTGRCGMVLAIPQRIACSYMRDTVVLSYVCGTFTRPSFLHPGFPSYSR
jgi:hypothetical protein